MNSWQLALLIAAKACLLAWLLAHLDVESTVVVYQTF